MPPQMKPQNAVGRKDSLSPPYGASRPSKTLGYSSEDEDLSDGDLNVLGTDYSLQRHLTFPHHSPLPRTTHARPTSSDAYSTSEEEKQYTEQPTIPPRDASLRQQQVMSRYDYPDYRLSTPEIPHRSTRAYQYSRGRRRPLIDLIKNEWKNPSSTNSSSPSNYDYLDGPGWLQICFAPRFQRAAAAILLVLFLSFVNWKMWMGPKFHEQYGLRQSIKDRMKDSEGWFGENLRPEFLDMVHLETLDDGLLPGVGQSAPGDRRLIVIGDVHGCHDELQALLTEAHYEAKTDHLIFAGDMVAKGPSSPAVVDLAISARASCVRGNHEDRVLLTYRDMSARSKKAGPPAPGVPEGAAEGLTIPEDDGQDEDFEELSRLDVYDRKIARQLSKKHIDYLSQCPVILDIGKVPGIGGLHVVHAGLIPGVGLEQQDPIGAMHMRTVDLETHVPSSSGKGTPWYKLWNKYQSLLPTERRSTVIYGHDSKKGLQLDKFSKGIDTGCFDGGKLSALVINGTTEHEPQLVSVDCKNYRKLEKDAEGRKAT